MDSDEAEPILRAMERAIRDMARVTPLVGAQYAYEAIRSFMPRQGETSAGPIPPSIPEGALLYGYHERSGLHRWNDACPDPPKGERVCSPVYMHPDVFKALVAQKTPSEGPL
jgi:hypothetical protein